MPEQNDAQNEQSNHHSDHKETLDTHAMQNCPDDEPKNDIKENGKEKVINDNFLREHSLEQHWSPNEFKPTRSLLDKY